MIRMEAEHTEHRLPLEVFPQTVQSVILDMARYENYKTEFIATAMISAVSAALGGTYRIRIKGECEEQRRPHHPRGQAGTGQDTAAGGIPPHTEARLCPFKAYESELEVWKAAGRAVGSPYCDTVVSDFTRIATADT